MVCRYGTDGCDVELHLGMVKVDTLSLHIYRDKVSIRGDIKIPFL